MKLKLNLKNLVVSVCAAVCGIVAASAAAASMQLTDLSAGSVEFVNPQIISWLNYVTGIAGIGVIIFVAILWYLHRFCGEEA